MILMMIGSASRQITTPMALAALVLMLGAPIIRQILNRKGRPTRDTRLAFLGIFILGLVFGVLAFVSFIYGQSTQTEVRVSGAVRDDTGAGVASARVAIDGRDSGSTSAEGEFAFTIPASRASDQYVVRVYHEGYIPAQVTISGLHPQPVSVELKRPAVSLEGVLSLPSSMIVRHNLGVPSLEVVLTYANPLPSDLFFSDIGVTLISPAGERIPMMMEGVSVLPGKLDAPLTQWNLTQHTNYSIDYFFFNSDAEFFALQQRAFAELAPKAAVVTEPDPQVELLSPALVSELRRYMNAHFIWTSGTWKVIAHARVKGQRVEATSTFVLSESVVKKMRAIANYYPSALGVAPAWRFLGTADANPVANVALEPVP